MKRCLLLLLSSSLLSCFSYGGVTSVSIKEPIVKQYDLVVVDVELEAEWESPYSSSDIALEALITAPSGRELLLPGFYVEGDSGSQSLWRLHFSPREIGQYDMEINVDKEGVRAGSGVGASFVSTVGDSQGYLRSNDLWTLEFDSGKPFRGVGINYGWEPRDEDDSRYFSELHENPRFEYENFIPKLSDSGVNIIRTWMIYWNLPVDWQAVDNASRYENSSSRFNKTGAERLDDLIGLAEENDMYVMLVLDSHAGYISEGWEINPYNKKNGGYASTPKEFFSFEESREQYKDKLRYMVARWGYSTRIAAWEFFNEVDNIMYEEGQDVIPDSVVVDWHKEMSDYLVSIDPFGHIVTTSISHRDVEGLNDIDNIHINQRHMYKETGNIPEAIDQYTKAHDKPYIIGEFGYEWDWQINFNEIKSGKVNDFKRGLWLGMFSPTPVMPMSWWWEYFDEKGVVSYFSCVKEMNDHILSTATSSLSSKSVDTGNSNLVSKGVINGKKSFVYVGNPTDVNQEFSLKSIFEDSTEGLSYAQVYECGSAGGSYRRISDTVSSSSNYYSVIEPNDNLVIIY